MSAKPKEVTLTRSPNLRLVLLLILIASVAKGAVASPAGAGDGQGKIDIVFVKASGNRNGTGRFELGTEKRLRCRYLRPAKDRRLKWSFDDARDGDFDLVGRFLCKEGHLLFLLRGTRTHNRYEPIQPRRPSRRSLVVRFPLDVRELGARHLSTVAKSRDAQSPGCVMPCRDRAPDSGFLHVY